MNLSSSGVTYAFMVIPLLFVIVVIVQGIEKIMKHETEGTVAVGFGLVFLVLIIAAYFLYIK